MDVILKIVTCDNCLFPEYHFLVQYYNILAMAFVLSIQSLASQKSYRSPIYANLIPGNMISQLLTIIHFLFFFFAISVEKSKSKEFGRTRKLLKCVIKYFVICYFENNSRNDLLY